MLHSKLPELPKPWLNPSLRFFMKFCNAALHKFKRSRTDEDWQEYKRLINLVVSAVRREKKNYIDSLSSLNNSRKLWCGLKKLNVYNKVVNSIPANISNADEIINHFGALQHQDSCSDESCNFYNNNLFKPDKSVSFNLTSVDIRVHNID